MAAILKYSSDRLRPEYQPSPQPSPANSDTFFVYDGIRFRDEASDNVQGMKSRGTILYDGMLFFDKQNQELFIAKRNSTTGHFEFHEIKETPDEKQSAVIKIDLSSIVPFRMSMLEGEKFYFSNSFERIEAVYIGRARLDGFYMFHLKLENLLDTINKIFHSYSRATIAKNPGEIFTLNSVPSIISIGDPGEHMSNPRNDLYNVIGY